MVYKIYIACPTGVTCTLRFSLIPEQEGAIPSVLSEDAGDLLSELLYVRGDAVHNILVPFNSSAPVLSMAANPAVGTFREWNCGGRLVISLVNKVVNPFAIATSINIVVLAACGDDMRFFSLRDDTSRTYQGDGDAYDTTASAAKPILPAEIVHIDGFTNLQEFRSWKEYFMMPHLVNMGNAAAATIEWSPIDHRLTFESQTFAAFRGSRRVMLYPASTTTYHTRRYLRSTLGNTLLGITPIQGICYVHFSYFEQPWSANTPFMFYNKLVQATPQLPEVFSLVAFTNMPAASVFYLSCSDDAQFFIPSFVPSIVCNNTAYLEP